MWGWHWSGSRGSRPLSPWQDRAAQLQATGSDVHVEVSDNALLALQGSGGPTWPCPLPGPLPVNVTALPTSPPFPGHCCLPVTCLPRSLHGTGSAGRAVG